MQIFLLPYSIAYKNTILFFIILSHFHSQIHKNHTSVPFLSRREVTARFGGLFMLISFQMEIFDLMKWNA